MYINIHTHKNLSTNNQWELINVHHDFQDKNPLFKYSLGIHPWHIEQKSVFEQLSLLKINSKKENVLAIGECGLDRISETPFKLQQELFKDQILWANEIAKPLIIHCIRAYDEVLKMLKDNKNIMPVIFHGFNKNESTAEKIIKAGHYISIGKDAKNIEIEKTINTIPLERLFLETDDSDIIIETIYKEVSRIRNIPLTHLILQIQKNLKTVFNIS